jgi:pyridoxal 5'-phosphate synthase pdxT subunit
VNKLVGVLAIQGDFQAHLDVLKAINVESREVRNLRDLDGVTHLIVPGGESTTIRKIAQSNGLWEKLGKFDKPVMGTCMGSILMARQIQMPDALGWGMLDLTIERNAYGRQVHSFTAMGKLAIDDNPFEMVFIRAPKFVDYGKDVTPIAWLGDEVTGVVSGNKLALTFHPELTGSTLLHRYFLEI